MIYFNPKPDYQKLSKYYELPYSSELMEQHNPDGYAIVLNHVETDEAVAQIEDGFKTITGKYNLQEHYDNLFYLVLGKVQEHEAILDELFFQYNQRKRTKEFANLLLAFSSANKNQYDSVILKTLRSTTKLTDKTNIDWVGKTLTEAILDGKMLLKDYEYRITEAFFKVTSTGKQLDIEKLSTEANTKIKLPTKDINASYANICFYLYPYLIAETNIKPNSNTLLSDALANFYFDILSLFGYLDQNKIKSDNKDYMATLLKNRVKSLNPNYQGNKNS